MYTLVIITLLALPGRPVERLVPDATFGPMTLEACLLNAQLMAAQKQPDSRVLVAGSCLMRV